MLFTLWADSKCVRQSHKSTSSLAVRFQPRLILFREAPKLPGFVQIVKCACWLIEVTIKQLNLCHCCSQIESPEWLDHPGPESGGLHVCSLLPPHPPSPLRLTYLVCHLPYWKEDWRCCLWRTAPNQMGCRTKWEVQGNSPNQVAVRLINQGEMFSRTS